MNTLLKNKLVARVFSSKEMHVFEGGVSRGGEGGHLTAKHTMWKADAAVRGREGG
jgi:hypothetical protein